MVAMSIGCIAKVYRPWGKYDSIDAGDRYRVKRITVKPGEGLSVPDAPSPRGTLGGCRGNGKVTIDGDIKLLGETSPFYIFRWGRRVAQKTRENSARFSEVRSGSYLEEDDVVRFADRYGRV